MFLKKVFSAVFVLCTSLSFSQEEINVAKKYASKIDSVKIRQYVSVLASDSLEGRDTGTEGQKKAAAYIQNKFREFGLDSLSTGYLQQFPLYKKNKSAILYFNKLKLNFPEDFGFHGFYDSDFLAENDVDNTLIKVVAWDKFKKDKFYLNNQVNSLIITVNSYLEVDFDLIKTRKIKNVFFICKFYNESYFTKYTDGELTFSTKGDSKNPQRLFFINRKKLKEKKALNSIQVKINPLDEVLTENVIAYVEGSDSILKKEFIVISAHYDHLGIKNGEIYNGADDNGSGTSALIELARIFQEAKKNNENPKRSILFICFTGEEHGLFGSDYYSQHPLIPLKNTVADFNIDMIGRKDSEKEKSQLSVYVIGSDKISYQFHKKHEEIAKLNSNLRLDYKYNDFNDKEKLYYRSDHYNFAKNGIPSIFYFGGFHSDYHMPTDDIEKLNFTKIKAISELVFFTAWGFGM